MVWLGFGDCWQPQNSQYKKDPGTFQDLINKTLVAKGNLQARRSRHHSSSIETEIAFRMQAC